MSTKNNINTFESRHIGANASETTAMLQTIGVDSLETLIAQTVPENIRLKQPLQHIEAQSEFEYLRELKKVAAKNKVFRSYIGMGYNGTITPSVILRNIFQNPGWYTQYTPYQAEIAQGRLEALLNFQTVISDLTGLPIANASLLDEGTSAAEAMNMFFHEKNKRTVIAFKFFVDAHVLPATLDVLTTRAQPLGIEIIVGDWKTFELTSEFFGVMLQYPNAEGAVEDYRAFSLKCNENKIHVIVAADILSLTLLMPPGEWGADCVVGTTQRFGVPLGFGGPHAAFFATKEEYKRNIPGRIIGVSVDAHGRKALRMALQTREQHIRREKATSNICTAQALLSIMASMYAVYHGSDGLKKIATIINNNTKFLAQKLSEIGFDVKHTHFFDTISVEVKDAMLLQDIKSNALKYGINFWYGANNTIQIALDETINDRDMADIFLLFLSTRTQEISKKHSRAFGIPDVLVRTSAFLTHPIFNSFHTESSMMRYIKRLENKDVSLMHSMIALGSCTMKLNAASELIPVSWEEFANIHPLAPTEQTRGYKFIIDQLSKWLCDITGFTACSFQPNSGAQGEYAGLLTIRAYHLSRGEAHRNIAIIPSSAHGTNPASAVMAGMEVVVTACDEKGNIDVSDLRAKAEQHKDNLACLMVTYPSTHGVFETSIQEVCKIIHDLGGKVYMDGANMNAQVGLTSPNEIGADVCHLNLHKTFAIPHGGGGPGVGPICCNTSLAPFLPSHVHTKTGGKKGINAVSSAPFGSSSILLISYGYVAMLGSEGVTNATKYAILNANYMKARLEKSFPVLYTGENGRCAHEMILDLRTFKSICSAEDVAKRLMDYGFHAPTLSFPVAGTIMIEPTESENKEELDRFCDALLEIRKEIDEIANGDFPADNNVLCNAPHTAEIVTADNWNYAYPREKAAYPLPYLKNGYKIWATVSRINSAQGDRNLICTCPPLENYMQV